MADINKEFGRRLKELIKREGIKQKVLAEFVGITPSALTFHLKGQVPSSDILLKYAKRFGVSVDFLLTGMDSASEGELESLRVPQTSPLYFTISDILEMPRHRQEMLREIFRVIIESDRKQKVAR
jgi:transcriptional regulator with XRE-family HTH domain